MASCWAADARRTAPEAFAAPWVGHVAATFVASVWLTHGLYNKLLGGSPRHLSIVQSVPGLAGPVGEHVLAAVGIFEVAIAVWILAGVMPRLCAAVQTIALLSMNVLELSFAPHLLLWPAALIPLNVAFLTVAWVAAATRQPSTWLRQRAPLLRTWLKRHPMAIDAHFDNCLTMTYALPAEVLQPLLPPGLQLDTLRGYGFVAVAMVQTEALRPAGMPRALGQHFFLAGYRVFVKFRTPSGHTVRGLRILRSDTNRWRMVIGGNLLTHYNYHRCDSSIDSVDDRIHLEVRTRDGGGDLDVIADPSLSALPSASPFASLREARYFAGPLPYTFDYEKESHAIIAIEAVRTKWKPSPIAVDVRCISFFNQPSFRGCTPILAAAFQVRDIDYRWKRGVYHALPSEEIL